ncbi:hypothetical protein V6N11_051651 [Hibiscus sabdariffa]|uniref:Protein kinase domain-containing protein n=1 Tax=Hibiscus sabdariffa TaxID=183260 RepID=A0ABR2U889_9ROSI
MGCVLGKQSQSSPSDHGRRINTEAPPPHSRTCRLRSSEESSSVVSVNDAVDGVVAVKEKMGKRQQQRKARHTGDFHVSVPAPERLRMTPDLNQKEWPSWLMAVAGEAIGDWTPRRANTFQKLDKIGQGTYSNVYKARDLVTGKVVALKKVRFDNLEAESVKFMAREILVLRKLDHPNVIKLEGLVTSRMSCSLYLVFEYMEHDLAGLAACQGIKFTEPQVKCYMKQLLSGLEHCHKQDFGLATSYVPGQKKPLTSRVVTLWYRPPELLLGATYYGVGVDLWSAGCILAELLSGKPIMPGKTEVEQLHKIFKLCGTPSEEYWKKSKLPNAALFKPQHPYKCCIGETFMDFPPSSLSLIETLLSIDPDERSTATAALNSEFFTTEPYACEPSSLPKYHPSKEIDVKLRDREARQRSLAGKVNAVDGTRRTKVRERPTQAVPAPEANAETQANLDKWKVMAQTNAKSKSEKFPPPHQDGAVGHPVDASNKGPVSFGASETSFSSSIFNSKSSGSAKSARHAGGPSRRKTNRDSRSGLSQNFMRSFKPSSIGISMDMLFKEENPSSGSFKSINYYFRIQAAGFDLMSRRRW